MEVNVLGAGIGGLSVAALLAKNGFKVNVIEQNDSPGGKAGQIKADGYVFDTGPSLLTLPNWIDDSYKISTDTHRYLGSRKVKVLYSGNIGEKQDWNAFLKFSKEISAEKYEIIVVGDGAKKNWLVDNIKPFPHVKHFLPVPLNELPSLLKSADIHILFQKAGVIDAVMPSKILGMMASSRPSLVIGDLNSEIKTIFDYCRPGIFFDTYSDQVILELDKLIGNFPKMVEMGKSANKYVVANFSKNNILNGFFKKIDSL